jgi:hypothetical protein
VVAEIFIDEPDLTVLRERRNGRLGSEGVDLFAI